MAAVRASALLFYCQLREAPVHNDCDQIARQVFAPVCAMCPEQTSRSLVKHEHVQVTAHVPQGAAFAGHDGAAGQN